MRWLRCRRKVNFWLRLLIKVPCQIWTRGPNICAVLNSFVDLVRMRPITIPSWSSAGARGHLLIRCYLFSTAALTHPGANGVSSPFLWRRFTGIEGGKVSWLENFIVVIIKQREGALWGHSWKCWASLTEQNWTRRCLLGNMLNLKFCGQLHRHICWFSVLPSS